MNLAKPTALYERCALLSRFNSFAKTVGFAVLIGGLNTPVVAYQDEQAASNSSQEVLQLLHENYPPYVYLKDGQVVGTVAELATEILDRAGYIIEWRITNYRRLVREIELSSTPLCAAGYNEQHNQTYNVLASKPFIWFPGSALAIRKADLNLFSGHESISDILSDETLRGAFLMGAQYIGVDAKVQAGEVERHILIGSTDVDLGLLVAKGRVHFALINPDQTNHIIQNNDLASNLMVYRPSGMASPRHVGFICSKATSGDVMNRINASIEPIGSNNADIETKKTTPN